MKLIILLLLLTFNVQASFIAVSDLKTCETPDLFSHKEICESDKKGECIDFPGGFCQQYDIEDNWVDDYEWPIYAEPSEVENCVGKDDCDKIIKTKECKDPSMKLFIDIGNTVIYCSKILSYNQKVDGKKLVSNSTKLQAIEAERALGKIEDQQVLTRKESARDILDSIDINEVKSIEELKPVLDSIIELLKESR